MLQAQEFNPRLLESSIQHGVKQAYHAVVHISGYDSSRKVTTSGRFSGVVVSADGVVLSAAHAVTPGNVYKVTFPDGVEAVAVGKGRITAVDAAILHIVQPGRWPYARMGRSANLLPYDGCLSISHPGSMDPGTKPVLRFGYIAEPRTRSGMIRSTCLMEPGDSGGPLFDLEGNVVGIHSRINVGFEDNFEISIDDFLRYWTALNAGENHENRSRPTPADPAIAFQAQHSGLAIAQQQTGKDNMPGSAHSTKYVDIEGMNAFFAKSEAILDASSVLIESRTTTDTASKVIGTLLDLNGVTSKKLNARNSYIISKSSLVGILPTVQVADKTYKAIVLARSDSNDLVLLKVAKKLKGGIIYTPNFAPIINDSSIGRFLISADPISSGKVSVVGSGPFSIKRKADRGFLGVAYEFKRGQVILNSVSPNTAASKANLLGGDIVGAINGVKITSMEAMSEEIIKYDPGETITLTGMRQDSVINLAVTLGKRPEAASHAADRFHGGKSLRRDGFTGVFSHDATLRPNECGGPIFDTEGVFVGINIARLSRVSSLAISAETVWGFVKEFVSEGKL